MKWHVGSNLTLSKTHVENHNTVKRLSQQPVSKDIIKDENSL